MTTRRGIGSMSLSVLPILFASMLTANAWATAVTYTATNLGGSSWRYDYTVGNDSLAVNLEEFTVYFALGTYTNLVANDPPTDWDPLVAQPDPDLPDDGFFDALALAGGIAPGDSLGGFSVTFDYSGAGVPGPQPFKIVDPVTIATRDAGVTATVPLPGALWLMSTALATMAARAGRRPLRRFCPRGDLRS